MQRYGLSFLCVSFLAAMPVGRPAHAQGFRQAIPGTPFGVAQFSIPLPAGANAELLETDGFQLQEKNGRVFYPAFSGGQLQRAVSDFLGRGQLPFEPQLSVTFLFTGTEPLELTVQTPTPYNVTLYPDAGKTRWYRQSLQRWWQSYHNMVKRQVAAGDYPPLVQVYLTSLLSRRMGLETPWFVEKQQASRSELEQSLQRLSGADELRYSILRETMRGGGGLTEPADLPVPPEISWTPLSLPDIPAPVEVEPLAFHVPEECFYLRFGSFENYLWLDHLKDDYGGDIMRMVTLRGHNARLEEKLQRQLALKQSALAEIVGPQIIADVALIGRDLYLREGAASGMLFHARTGRCWEPISTRIVGRSSRSSASRGLNSKPSRLQVTM